MKSKVKVFINLSSFYNISYECERLTCEIFATDKVLMSNDYIVINNIVRIYINKGRTNEKYKNKLYSLDKFFICFMSFIELMLWWERKINIYSNRNGKAK